MFDLNGASIKVFIAICRKTIGWHKISDAISYSQLKRLTGLSSTSCSRSLQELEDWGIITVDRENGQTNRIDLIFDPCPESGQAPIQKVDNTYPESGQTKETQLKKQEARVSGKPDPVTIVIDYLNKRTGRKYNPNTKATHRLITARVRDGHHYPDFQRVIDSKVKAWSADPKMADYLRPETLFGTKFDSYLAACEPLKAEDGLSWTCGECGSTYRSTAATCVKCGWQRP